MTPPKLIIELVPASSWGDNLRTRLTTFEWDILRKRQYFAAGNRCQVCGGSGRQQGFRWALECHERWKYVGGVQILLGVIALCPRCHLVTHMGRSISVGRGNEAKRHLMKVNGWTKKEAGDYIKKVFTLWQKRSNMVWAIDLSWLLKQGIQIPKGKK